MARICGRPADEPGVGGFFGEAATFHIRTCVVGGGIAQKAFVKVARGLVVQFFKTGGEVAFLFGFRVVSFFDEWDRGPLRQFFQSVHELQILVAHDKSDRAAAFAAAKTFEILPNRIDREGGRFFVVKRAVGFVKRAHALERQVRTHHVNDVVGGQNLFDYFFWNASHEVSFKMIREEMEIEFSETQNYARVGQ